MDSNALAVALSVVAGRFGLADLSEWLGVVVLEDLDEKLTVYDTLTTPEVIVRVALARTSRSWATIDKVPGIVVDDSAVRVDAFDPRVRLSQRESENEEQDDEQTRHLAEKRTIREWLNAEKRELRRRPRQEETASHAARHLTRARHAWLSDSESIDARISFIPSRPRRTLEVMMKPRRLPVSLIAACSLNRVIGKQGRLPWQLPCDWAWFATATQGQVLIVGRKSFEEFGEPVPNRHTIVVSPSRVATASEKRPHMHAVASLDAAIALAHDHPRYAQSNRIFVGGGERLYQEALDRDLIESCYVTRVHQHIADGDAFLPPWTSRCPELVFNTTTKASNGTSLSFGVWCKTK